MNLALKNARVIVSKARAPEERGRGGGLCAVKSGIRFYLIIVTLFPSLSLTLSFLPAAATIRPRASKRVIVLFRGEHGRSKYVIRLPATDPGPAHRRTGVH